MSKVLRIENLKAYYIQMLAGKRVHVRAVDDVNLTVRSNEVVGIIGESGCGKSTLARAILADFSPPLQYISGGVFLRTKNGKELELHRFSRDMLRRYVWGVEIALVPQFAMNALTPTLRIRRIIMDIMKSHFDNVEEKEVVERASKIFQSIGLPGDVVDRYPFELSGGMRQRVVLGLVAMLGPSIMIADEPTSALDVSTQKIVLKTMLDLKKQGYVGSIIFITHEIGAARQIATRFNVMYAGKIVEEAPTEEFIEKPYHPYSSLLIKSIPDVAEVLYYRGSKMKKEFTSVAGAPPNLAEPPTGCRFHPRCPYAMDVCRREEPPMIHIESNRFVACWLYVKK